MITLPGGHGRRAPVFIIPSYKEGKEEEADGGNSIVIEREYSSVDVLVFPL